MRRTDGPFPIWEILPGQLYQRGKLHGMTIDRKLDGLLYYNISHCVTLAPPTPDPAAGLMGTYTHLPIPDGLLHNGDALLDISARLAAEIAYGGTVLTMCNAGRNRSGLLSALIVRELTGLPGAAAMAVVRHHRPRALANPHFEAFLEGLS